MLEKSRSVLADCVTYDLEDSVTLSMKDKARGLVRAEIDRLKPDGLREQAVRINSVGSGLAEKDLKEIVWIHFKPS